ncbi:hypothetical protein V5799_007258 [Amblyomma americanum]|uniref:Major facilitator superfamily (MFS) profile domain-containing protein n=1 Tax=Amblyomma americanum TaxID=6943 RepID=A0AAQ4DU19_AMBAM
MSADSRALIQENVYAILGHGRFQHSVLVFTTLTVIVLLLHAFAYLLIGRPVDHWCQPPSEFRDWPVEQWRNVAIPVLADGSFSRCTVYSPPVPDDDLEERREVACNRWDYNATHVGDRVVSMWDLVCEHQWLYSISSSVYIMGPLCLVPVAGIIADRVGSTPVVLASAASMLLASMAASTTKALDAFLMARFIISAAISATNVLNFIVLYEVTGNEHQALYIFLANIVGTTVPPVLYSLLSLLHPSWRLSHALFVAASAIVVLACCYSLEESPVWQLVTWRIRQAESTVLHVAKYNGVDGVKARATFRALKRQLEKGETASGAGTSASETIFLSTSFRRRAVSIILSWFGVNFAYYASRMDRMNFEAHWEVSAYLFKILLLIALYYSLKNLGQRFTLSVVLALLSVCGAFQTVSYELKLSFAMPFSTLMVLTATTAAMCVNYTYAGEVVPTAIRSVGFCISYSVGRVGVLLVTLINAFTVDQRLLALNVVMTVLSLVSAVAVQWLPEIFSHQKKDPDPSPLDAEQNKEALKTCLHPFQTSAKAEKSRKPHGDRKSNRVATSLPASCAASAVKSGAASPALASSPPQVTGSRVDNLVSHLETGESSSKAGDSSSKASEMPDCPRQKTGSPSKNNGPPLETATCPSELVGTLLDKPMPPSLEPGSPMDNVSSPSEDAVLVPRKAGSLPQNIASPPEVSSKHKSKKARKHHKTAGGSDLN